MYSQNNYCEMYKFRMEMGQYPLPSVHLTPGRKTNSTLTGLDCITSLNIWKVSCNCTRYHAMLNILERPRSLQLENFGVSEGGLLNRKGRSEGRRGGTVL